MFSSLPTVTYLSHSGIFARREQVERGKWSDSVRNLRASTISWARRISWTSTLEADGESSYTSTCASYRGRRLHHLQFGHVNRNRVRNHVRQPTQMKTRLQFRPKPSPWLPTKWRHRLLHHTKINQTHRRRRQYQVRRVLRLRHLPRVVIPENLQPSNQELLDVIILFTPRFMKEIGGSDAVLAGKLEEDMLRDFSATGWGPMLQPDVYETLQQPYAPVDNRASYPGLQQGYYGPTPEVVRRGDSPVALFFLNFIPVGL
ncbi:hypothetical protein PC116_g13211 [Phytophthora cactorum]|nr:hypothetical protein PC112_g9718 [Phytophthora cactorum]KAG2829477.1 hypothetical protein PC111_g7739 [Phytophthora cactorum]KAG2905420.1 hypothetical protein PC114_g11539 [Phytophthora cactorum]KAG3022964.1 hypothetical protein PC119_g9077 [Phytophthora cactorum]KAG3170244.1 hypothetical protein C6341_g10855 [Phytophthora cactorum]